MNGQNFGEHFNTSGFVEQADQDTKSPVVNSEPPAEKVPVSAALVQQTPVGEANSEFPAPLLNPIESEHLRTRWDNIQGKFVDEPRSAVQQADALVSEVVEKITRMFADEHSALEGQWKQGNDVSTEDLRKALQHYRSFFNRLVV